MIVDDAFLERWHPIYDKVTKKHDEHDYQCLLKIVRRDVRMSATLQKETLERIYDWKAPRAKPHVKWERYRLYANMFRKALENRVKPDEKVAILDNLPGIGIPVASTILHLVYPEIFPIVDFRTVEVLRDNEHLDQSRGKYYYRDTIEGYQVFRSAVEDIARQCPKWSLRQIDRALFAYHKRTIGRRGEDPSSQAP